MIGVNSAGTMVNDFLGFFGVRGAGVGVAIDSLTGNSAGVLANLHDQFLETAIGRGTGPMERMMGTAGGAPWATPFMMPSPISAYPTMMPLCGVGYGGVQQMDLAPGSTNIPIFSKLFSPERRMAGQFERMLRCNPQARAAFEAQIGGRIVDFGIRNDGVFTVQRFAPGAMPGMPFNPMASTAMAYVNGMNSAVMGHPAFAGISPALMGNPFMGMTMAGMNNVLGAPAGAAWSAIDNSGPRGGWGFGSWNPLAMPGRINNTNPAYESAHQAETASVLADPSLTVEDKVTLMIMLIMKKMDKDIENQAQYLNSIQQQQGARTNTAGKGKGNGMGMNAGPFGEPGGNSSPSIDVETMKLKRMIDKRSQMFDMLRQIIDKYNETAKGIIQSIGR
jgi:hypothetical protein